MSIKSSNLKPIILYEGENTLADLENLKKKYPIWQIIDIYLSQLEELFEINNPSLKQSSNYKKELAKFIQERSSSEIKLKGNWIYFPWNGNLVHTVSEDEYFQLRTNRNQNLITKEEQERLINFNVCVIGLSVGSNIATNLSYHGIGSNIKLADFDTLETTNLNRIKAGISQIGLKKINLVAQQIYEINPYANLSLYPEGLNIKNLEDILNSNSTSNLIFEIIDNFEMKVRLRIAAREKGIPVIMMANLGDSIQVDIERYDLDKNTPIFNDVLGDLPEQIINNPNEDPNKYAIKMVGIENVPKKALESVKEIGKTLVGRPQLSSTVSVSGGLAAFLARKIALKKDLPSGRIMVKFNEIFNIKYD